LIEFFALTPDEFADLTFADLRVYEQWMATALKGSRHA
jgi:hypothetical protein